MKKHTPQIGFILSALAVSGAFIVSVANAQNTKMSAGSARDVEMLVKYDANSNGKLDAAEFATMQEHEMLAAHKKGTKKGGKKK